MTFKEQMAADLSTVFFNTDDFAESAIYTPVSGAAVACSVLIDHNIELQPSGLDSQVSVTATVIESMVSEVGIPVVGATFTIGSTEYEIRELLENDGLITRVAVA
jgi:hypothetical protein